MNAYSVTFTHCGPAGDTAILHISTALNQHIYTSARAADTCTNEHDVFLTAFKH